MSEGKTPEEAAEQLKQIIRDEIAMFAHKGPGWWNNHDPLEFHRCPRCNTKIEMGYACPCEHLGNTKIINGVM
ncbi:MAG: hypothetical protein ACYSW8_30855 [Planctomycetota bacterium]|jgi:predicted ArsR family transcriptional regulator